MSQLTVTLPDGSTKSVPSATTVGEIAASISPRLAQAAYAGMVNGRLVDLTYPLHEDAKVRVLTSKDPEALTVYRHSTAHLLAAAVTQLFPKAQCGIGPPTDEGFFYDFVVEHPFVPDDLDAIEKRMREIASADLIYERQMWPREEAIDFFRKRGEPLKVQLIEEKTAGQKEVSVYTIKDRDTFVDFCVGPHVPSSGRLKAFKLLTTSNAYWKGDARNQPMQRIYGTAFFSENELKAYLTRIEEAKKRDHRKLGRELGLFLFHPWAAGATFWLEKGTTLYNLLGNYMRGRPVAQRLRGSEDAARVQQGALGNVRALGALPPEHVSHRASRRVGQRGARCRAARAEGDELSRPHAGVRKRGEELSRSPAASPRADTAASQRGVGHAVGPDARAAVLSQDDAHCFVMESQIGEEVERLLRLVQRVYGDFGLKPEMRLSTRPAEFLGDASRRGPMPRRSSSARSMPSAKATL